MKAGRSIAFAASVVAVAFLAGSLNTGCRPTPPPGGSEGTPAAPSAAGPAQQRAGVRPEARVRPAADDRQRREQMEQARQRLAQQRLAQQQQPEADQQMVIPPPPDVAGIPPNAQRTASGLGYRVLKPGSGPNQPSAESMVEVHYTGWTTDGKMFDSSYKRGRPVTFPLNRVIAGWTEGVQMMKVGEKRRLWIPEELAYKGRPGAPQGMLVFDVELMRIVQ